MTRPPERRASTTKAAAATTSEVPGPQERVPGASWVVEDPDAEGMDADAFEEARSYAFVPERNTQGVMVVRHGAIVSEWYADGADADSWTASWSVAKSFSSAVTGIAVADGSIDSVDDPAATYLDEWAGTDKADITVEDILHMQSGLAWDEDYQPSSADSSDVVQMGLSANELAYAAARHVAKPPGSTWVYERRRHDPRRHRRGATGTSMRDYATERLFKPIGMERLIGGKTPRARRSGTAAWTRRPAAMPASACCTSTKGAGVTTR